MPRSICKRAVLIAFCIIGVYCSNSKRVIERIKHLESRFNTESNFRDEDYAEVIDRLDEIDKRLNASLGQKVGDVNLAQETDEVDLESAQHLREDFTRLWTAFKDEKSETARIRREIPKIENNLISMKQDMDKYCMINLNKTEQLISRVQQADEFIKTNIALQINEMDEGQKALLNEINEEQKALLNEINVTSVLEREEFKVVAAQIEENIRNTVGRNTEKIENIDMILMKLSTHIEHLFLYDSCSGTLRIGVYKLRNGHKVFCDQTTDGGGWTVFQRRINGEVDFYRNWTEYKNGFGDLNGEFWLGNELLSMLTATGDHELRIDMEDFEGNRAFAKYSKFKIYPEDDKYKIEVSGYSGNAGDSLRSLNGMMFTTFDKDNDKYPPGNCAGAYHGAWWYNSCHRSNLNGQYFNIPGKIDHKAINWYYWKNSFYCLKSVEMKFR